MTTAGASNPADRRAGRLRSPRGAEGAEGAGRTLGRRAPARVVAPAQPDHHGAERQHAGHRRAQHPGQQGRGGRRAREVGHDQHDDAHGDRGDHDAPQRRPRLALGQAPDPLVEHRQGEHGGHGVGDGEGQGEAADAERVHQHQGQRDVQRVLDQVEVEGDLGPLHRLQHADEVEVGAEPGQAEREHGQGGAGGGRLGRGAVPEPEQQRDEGAGQEEHPDGRGDDQRQDGAQAARHPVQEGLALPGRPAVGQVGGDHRHDRDRDHAVGELHEGVGVDVGRDRVGPRDAAGQHGDDEEGDLVRHHEAEGPAAQAGHGGQRLVAGVPVPAQEAEVGAAQARDQRDALEHDAERGAQPEQDELAPVRLDAGQRGAVAGPQPEPDQDADAHEVVDDGRPGDGDELAARVEQGAAQGEQAVGGDLDHEPAQERGGHRPLLHDAVDLVGVGMGIERRQGVDEEGRRQQRGQGGDRQDDDGDGDDGGDRLERLLLVLPGQPVDEDRDERGREDPAQHDVVEHVRRRVGQVVGVGEGRLAERPGQRHEAEQPGDPRDAGPGRDVGGRGPQRQGARLREDGHVSAPGAAPGASGATCAPTRPTGPPRPGR